MTSCLGLHQGQFIVQRQPVPFQLQAEAVQLGLIVRLIFGWVQLFELAAQLRYLGRAGRDELLQLRDCSCGFGSSWLC